MVVKPQTITQSRHPIYKAGDIYECIACGKFYTNLMIDLHLDKCLKLEDYLAQKEKDEVEQLNLNIEGEVL